MCSILGLDSLDQLSVSKLYIRGLDVEETFVSVSAFGQSNSSNQLQLQNYVTNSVLTTTLAGYQRSTTSSNKAPYSNISGTPDLTCYQPLITASNKVPYSNVSGTPNLPYIPTVNYCLQ